MCPGVPLHCRIGVDEDSGMMAWNVCLQLRAWGEGAGGRAALGLVITGRLS